MKTAHRSGEPTQRSLQETPEVDFAAYRVRRNPFAKRIEREGIEIVVGRTVRRKAASERGPSAASLREIPEVDLPGARARRNPYAERIAVEGITLQVERGRPKRGTEAGPTVPKSIRLPERLWERIC